MDLKVYRKEEVKQPQGTIDVLTPDIIDIYPNLDTAETTLLNAEILEGKEETIQQVALATIWQRGLDPIRVNEGIQWSETYLGELNPVEVMAQITDAVADVSSTATVDFTTTNINGIDYLSFELNVRE